MYLPNLLEEFLLIGVVEGRVAAKQNVGNHAQTPHVHRGAIRLAGNNLGRDVARSAAGRGEALFQTAADGLQV